MLLWEREWVGEVSLPTDAKARKGLPLATGVIDYFPLALLAVAELSRVGNDQHNPGKALFWDRTKSQDEADALMRHFVERGTLDSDGIRHSVKVAWRALALLQKEIEAEVVVGVREIISPGETVTYAPQGEYGAVVPPVKMGRLRPANEQV